MRIAGSGHEGSLQGHDEERLELIAAGCGELFNRLCNHVQALVMPEVFHDAVSYSLAARRRKWRSSPEHKTDVGPTRCDATKLAVQAKG